MNDLEIIDSNMGENNFRGNPKNLSFWSIFDAECSRRLQESIHANGRELIEIWEWLEWQQVTNPEQAQINAGVMAAIGIMASQADDQDIDYAFMMFDQIARTCEMLNAVVREMKRNQTKSTTAKVKGKK